MKNKWCKGKWLIPVILLVMILQITGISVPAKASGLENGKLVRVGYTDYGQMIVEKDGEFSGYGVAYLKMISAYTGWEYEYVPVTEETEKLAALRTICEKYCPENMDAFEASAARSLPRTAVWRIEIVSITGKRKKYDAEGKEMTFGRME